MNLSFLYFLFEVIKIILSRIREYRVSEKFNFLFYFLFSEFCLLFDFVNLFLFLLFIFIYFFNQYTKIMSSVFKATSISSDIINNFFLIIKNYEQTIVLILEIWYKKSIDKYIRNFIIFFFILNIVKIYNLTISFLEKRY